MGCCRTWICKQCREVTLFFSLFDTGIPWVVIGIAVLMVALGSSSIYCKYKRTIQPMLIPWVVSCLFLMLYTAVIRRFQYFSDVSEVSEVCEVHLLPFWSIGAIRDGYIETMYEKIYNVIFFVPYGCLLGFRSFSNGASGFRGFKGAVLIGFLTSVGIVLLQLITRTGTCEIDDVICNTLGCGIGAVMGALTMTMRGISYDDDDDNDDFGS